MLEIGGFICRHEPGSQTFPTLVDIGVGEILSFTCFISSPANHGVCAFFFPFSERDRPCQKSQNPGASAKQPKALMPAVKGCHSMAPGFLGLLRVPIDSTEGSSVLPPHYCAVQSTPPKCEIQEQGGILVGGLANTPYPTSLMRDYQCD